MKRRLHKPPIGEAGRDWNGELDMMCPDRDLDCDNPGCRRGGCQGRRPKLPLFRACDMTAARSLPRLEAAMAEATLMAAERIEEDARLVAV